MDNQGEAKDCSAKNFFDPWWPRTREECQDSLVSADSHCENMSVSWYECRVENRAQKLGLRNSTTQQDKLEEEEDGTKTLRSLSKPLSKYDASHFSAQNGFP